MLRSANIRTCPSD